MTKLVINAELLHRGWIAPTTPSQAGHSGQHLAEARGFEPICPFRRLITVSFQEGA
jgi:hypothetical protein